MWGGDTDIGLRAGKSKGARDLIAEAAIGDEPESLSQMIPPVPVPFKEIPVVTIEPSVKLTILAQFPPPPRCRLDTTTGVVQGVLIGYDPGLHAARIMNERACHRISRIP